jgi:hypothetical protein
MDTTLLPNVVCTETSSNRLVRIDRSRNDGFFECTDYFTQKPLIVYRLFLQPMPTIPSRFKESQFRQVAEHIGAALREFPDCIKVHPKPYSAETIARKIREAINAKVQYGWKHPSINEDQFLANFENLVTSITEESPPAVIVGSRDAVKKYTQVASAIGTSEPTRVPPTLGRFEIVIAAPTQDELEHLCLLLHNKKLEPTPVFSVRGLTPDQIESLEQRYDVAILPTETDPSLFQIIA